jgi:PAS domain S-box-containing protein
MVRAADPTRRGEPDRSVLTVEEQAGLLDLAFDAILARSLTERKIVYWNRGAERLYGWTREEAIGRDVVALLQSEHPVPLEEIEDQVRAGGFWEGQVVQRAKDGRSVVVASRWANRRCNGGGDLILQIDGDVTEKVDAEEKLGENDQMLRLLVASVHDHAIFVLDPQGRVMSWNEGARRLKQYTQEEIVGQHFSVFYEPEPAHGGKPDWELVVARREGRYEEEGWRVRKDGSRFWANVVITPLWDGTGRLRGYAKITRDLTEKHLEAERRAALQRQHEEQLEQHALRMEALERAKSEFLNLASHELRNPIGVINSYLSMLEDGSLPPERLPEVHATLSAKVRHMRWLVDQLLEAARSDTDPMGLSLTEIDLRDVAADVARSYQLADNRRHPLRIEMPDEPVPVVADRARIETIVSALIDNAVKYSLEGGPVECLVAQSSEHAFVCVQDRGVGIDEADLARLFTRFGRIVTPENSHVSGTGLGLYLARDLAVRHGGDVLVESRKGEGSQFVLSLPRAGDPPPSSRPAGPAD